MPARSAVSPDRISSISPTPVVLIRPVALGTPEEIRAPLDYEPIQFAIHGVGVKVCQVVDEPLPLEVERRVAQDSVSRERPEGNEQIVKVGVRAWAYRLES